MAHEISVAAGGSGTSPVRLRAPMILIVFTIMVCGGALLLVAAHTILSPGHALRWSPWAYSEWLISYQSGFVRRGAIGTLIRGWGQSGDLLRLVNILVFAAYTTLVVGVALLVWLREGYPVRGAIALLMPGSIVQMAITNEMYYRKEILFHIFVVSGSLLVILLRASRRRWAAALAISAVSLGLPFVTEIFIFTTLPATVILLFFLLKDEEARRFRGLATGLVMAHLTIFVLLSLFKGDPAMAQAMWLSLPLHDRMMIDPGMPDQAAGGISAIGWSLAVGLKGPLWLAVTGFAWIWLLIGGALFILLRWLFLPDATPVLLLGRRVEPLSVVFLGALPLCLLGWDWGRWLSCGVISALAVCYAGDAGAPPAALGRLGRKAELLLLMALFATAFVTRMPECCLTGSSDPGYINIRDAIRHWH